MNSFLRYEGERLIGFELNQGSLERCNYKQGCRFVSVLHISSSYIIFMVDTLNGHSSVSTKERERISSAIVKVYTHKICKPRRYNWYLAQESLAMSNDTQGNFQ